MQTMRCATQARRGNNTSKNEVVMGDDDLTRLPPNHCNGGVESESDGTAFGIHNVLLPDHRSMQSGLEKYTGEHEYNCFRRLLVC